MKTDPTGDIYVNIGTEKSCLFIRMSSFLMRQLNQYPLLYYAIEEGLQCAKDGYCAAGIMAFSQLLNVLQQETPDARNEVAHKLLETRPSIDDFNKILEMVKAAADRRYQMELKKEENPTLYHQRLLDDWKKLMRRLLNSRPC